MKQLLLGEGGYLIRLVLQAQKKMKKGKSIITDRNYKDFLKEGDINFFLFSLSSVIFQVFPFAELRYQFVTQALWAEWWVLWTPSGWDQQQMSVQPVQIDYFFNTKAD